MDWMLSYKTMIWVATNYHIIMWWKVKRIGHLLSVGVISN